MRALIALYRAGQLAAAAAEAARLIAAFPNGEILHNIAGAISAAAGRPEEALARYDRAIALAPDYAEAMSNRGNTLKDLKRLDEALDSFDRALALLPAYVEAHVNRGIVLYRLKRAGEALAAYDSAIALAPTVAEAWNNRGNALAELHRLDDALASIDRALDLRADYVEAHVNRGNVLKGLKRLDEALAAYDRAIALSPDLADAHCNRGTVLKFLKRPDEALAAHERALALRPGHGLALSEALNIRAHMCDWSRFAADVAAARDGAPEAVMPFHFLSYDDDPARQLRRAAGWSSGLSGSGDVVRQCWPEPGPKIRIGYFSADFHNHATMYLMARLFELHDKARFEVHAFSFGLAARDAMRARLLAAVDAFHDVAAMSDADIAALSRATQIDIAVDLKGYTETARPAIFAARAAPVQISYLGYPGTMGAGFMDYILGDPVVIPAGDEHHYAETVIRLPHSYQVNDDRRDISDRVFTRAELGLPEDGFVFCCLNNNYKITPDVFDIWMRLLAEVEGSVLWLLADNRWAEANLRSEAAARGIDVARLVFARRVPVPEHLARQRCADLFLDTFNYAAHTTASDALWAGLPVVTKLGRSFAARVGASLLHAVGLPELVTETEEDYAALALALARDPGRLADVNAKLAANRRTAPLFDTARFTRDLEAIYERLATK